MVLLDPNDPFIGREIVRLYREHIDASRERKEKFERRQAVVVQHETTKRWVVRHAMGAGGGSYPKRAEVAVDYDTMDHLGVGTADEDECGPVTVRPARKHEILRYYIHHPDAGLRLATQMAVMSVGLGLVGALLGGLSVAFALV
jgi:hypothetical protein